MKIRFLGTGSSTGVPRIGCDCDVCTSDDSRNVRTRPSIMILDELNILIDTAPEFRTQIIAAKFKEDLAAVLFTHAHNDHIAGLDDIRFLSKLSKRAIDVFACKNTADYILNHFDYIFNVDKNYLGLLPKLNLHSVEHYQPFKIKNCFEVTPLPVTHGCIQSTVFRISKIIDDKPIINIGYVTDCSSIPESTTQHLQNLDLLILGCLDNNEKVVCHFNLETAMAFIEQVNPKKTLLTHLSHDLEHKATNNLIKTKTNNDIQLAYDGLIIEVL
jgi:phosphoribosyl 1,2-cyclic phosphate phosphodiesterase